MNAINTTLAAAALAATAALVGCSTAPEAPPTKDGELALPANYTSWPRFLPSVDREDVKQVRDIYMNPIATQVKKGEAFPQGSRFVMEIYAAAANPDGSLKKDAAGRLIKGNLLHKYVMGKEANWGGDVPEALRNGNWIYSAYKPDNSANTPIVNTCRGCHTPLKADDFVIRLDQYFAQRKSAFTVEQIHAQAGMAAQLADAQALQTLAKAAR